LVLELARSVEASPDLITWRQGRALAYGDAAGFSALQEVLKAHAGIMDSDDAASVERKLDRVLPEVEHRAWLRQRLGALLGLEVSSITEDESLIAWSQLLEHITASGPAILVLEDLHWAGEGMLAFLQRLAERRMAVPLLVLMTARPELAGRTLPLAAPIFAVPLAPLTQMETAGLMSSLLQHPLPPDVLTPVLDKIGGNPLYAEEFTRLLQDRGLLALEDGQLRLRHGEELPVPASLRAVLAARLDGLPALHKELLGDAAVIGDTFWRGGVAEISARSAEIVESVMGSLAEHELVRSLATPSIAGEAEYTFWHALARDVAYSQLPRKARATKHEAAAAWIERRAGPHASDFADMLAHHYCSALDLLGSIGETESADRLVEPAIRYLVLAGDRAMNLDVAVAEQRYAKALELAGSTGPERFRVLAKWAGALAMEDRDLEAVRAYRDAVEGLIGSGDVGAAALALCRLSRCLSSLGDPTAPDLPAQAVRLIEDMEPSSEQVFIYAVYAQVLFIYGASHPETVIEAATRALEVAGALGLPAPAEALFWRGYARLDLGDLAGLEECERAVRLASDQGLGQERARIEQMNAILALRVKGPRESVVACDRGLEFSRRRGLEAFVVEFRMSRIEALCLAGEWDYALAEIRDLVPVLEEAEDTWHLLGVRISEALVLARRGLPSGAAGFIEWLERQGRDHRAAQMRAGALLAAAAVRSAEGRDEVTLHLVAEFLRVTEEASAYLGVLEDMPGVMRSAAACGGAQHAISLARRTAALVPVQRLPLDHAAAMTVAALADELGGDVRTAAANHAEAAVAWHDLSVPYEEAQALLGQGRCLMTLDRPDEALEQFNAARPIFERLGAEPALAETDEQLGRAARS
ncbi:MAG TPA: hypothetical protein VFZ86_10560, partial [Thermoleophilia bacterium]|nr:hypothetical protein [Thermoleophilia bacterium]